MLDFFDLIDDVLAEGTRVLAAQEVPRIRAATDLADVPMATSFARRVRQLRTCGQYDVELTNYRRIMSA
ncbi:hypothetical protein [Streptomyces chryseus]